jgi:hypothetical protein
MKKALLLLFLSLLCSGSAAASTGAYMGLYTDSEHMYWCVSGVGFYPVEMWIWCLPGDQGVFCNEFMISYPPNAIQSTVTRNPIISVDLGDLGWGMSVCYTACQTDWFWNYHQLLWVTDPSQTQCTIVAHPDVGAVQIANCEPGYPIEPATVLTNLYINRPYDDPLCQGVATDEASWGAIKSLIDSGGE